VPAFRFDNVLGIARNVRAFLSIEGGVTRGSAPEDRRREISGQFETMRRRIQAQDDALRKKDAEISRLEERLRPTGAPTGALPDFVVIGAQKSGTTSFYRDVIRHPHVGRSTKKEVHFFDHNFDKGLDWYRAHFPSPELKDGRRTITGEASPYYLGPLAGSGAGGEGRPAGEVDRASQEPGGLGLLPLPARREVRTRPLIFRGRH